jgi:dihydrofolate reductase
MQCAITLDGYIAGPNEEFDWCVGEPEVMSAFFKTIDTVLLGRRTWDLMVRMGDPSFRGMKNYVFTKNPPASAPKRTARASR